MKTVFPTRYWSRLQNGRVRCELCPRLCAMREGQRGFCFVRACLNGEVVLTTYGRSNGLCIDPIEKKPLNHFYPGTPVLSFGTAGCNLTCKFCQNWDASRSQQTDRLGAVAPPDAIAKKAQQLGCRSVAFTYNDPIIFLEYADDTAKACQALGVKTVAVTAGYVLPKPREAIFRHMDAVNVDLKGFSDHFYRKQCGGELKTVLDTLRYLQQQKSVWMELTTLLIPGLNDSDQELKAMTRWVVEELGPEIPMHFTAFHPAWKMQDRPPTPQGTLSRAREIALGNGIRFAYTGNIRDRNGASTWCPQCGELLIGREGYDLAQWNLTAEGSCRFCGAQCPGKFDPLPGKWGSKRQAVQI